MILRTIFKNFLSFNEEEQFDMFPNLKRTSLAQHLTTIRSKISVLKMAALYGANGAGKSNLLKGLVFLREYVTKKNFLNPSIIDSYFYALKEDAKKNPIELTIEYSTQDNHVFLYSVQIARTGVEYEALYLSGLGNEANTIVFERKGNDISYGQELDGSLRGVVSQWIKNNPYSSLLTVNNDLPILSDQNIIRAQNWFKNEMEIIGIHSFIPQLIKILQEDERLFGFTVNMFNTLGLGIRNVKIKTEDLQDWINNHPDRPLPLDQVNSGSNLAEIQNFRNTLRISKENGIAKISQLLFEQYGKNGFIKDMDIQAQSDGTVRILSLIPALYSAIVLGKTVLIDEIDHSIHPHLIREIVRYFSSHETKGQLIFTTHQTCLLNQEFMRTDEIWFVEKISGESHMYSLNDFKLHHTINIENGYMEGRYGAIPFLGEPSLLSD